jgi:hypothetical protein
VLRNEFHKGRQWCVAQLGSTSQRDLILAIKFERQQSSGFFGEVAFLQIRGPQQRQRQFHIHGFHIQELPHEGHFVMRVLSPFRCTRRVPHFDESGVFWRFLHFSRVNNLRAVNAVFSSIPNAPTNISVTYVSGRSLRVIFLDLNRFSSSRQNEVAVILPSLLRGLRFLLPR